GPLRVVQPRGPVDAEPAEHGVEQAVLRVEQPEPDGRRRDGRGHHGDVEQGAEDARRAGAAVQQQRRAERDEQARGHVQRGVEGGVADGDPEDRVVDDPRVVVQAHPLEVPDDGVVGEAQPDRHDDGQEQEDGEQHDGDGEEDPGADRLLPAGGADRRRPHGGRGGAHPTVLRYVRSPATSGASSQNMELAQANHSRGYVPGSSTWKDSWTAPVPASVARIWRSSAALSAGSVVVSPCTARAMGHTWSGGVCGLPMPDAAEPLYQYGLAGLSTSSRVAVYS